MGGVGKYWNEYTKESEEVKGNNIGPYVIIKNPEEIGGGGSSGSYVPLSGEKDIAVANTPVALSSESLIVAKLNIKAKRDNVSYVAVGDNSTNANEGSEQGYSLEAEEPMPTLEHVDLAEVYVTGPNIGDGITYTALVEPS